MVLLSKEETSASFQAWETFINSVLRDSVLEQYTLPGGYTLPLLPGGGREVCCLSPAICYESPIS